MNKIKKYLLISSIFSTSLISAACTNNQQEITKKPNEIQKINYQIYPLPHNVKYNNELVKVTKIKTVIGKGLDQATQDKLNEVLAQTNTIVDKSAQYQLVVGIYKNDSEAEKYLKNNYKEFYDLFDDSKTDAHQIIIDNNKIVVMGKDTNAVFYAFVSLKDILKAKDQNSYIRHLQINDYADLSIRGTIEGFYGIPWGNENRAELINFGANFKSNAFIFAPKDDPYHREKWRSLYPKKDEQNLNYNIEGIEELAILGEKTKNHFYWAIHPFLGKDKISNEDAKIIKTIDINTFDFNNYSNQNQSIQDLLNKLNQVYNAGVRYFALLADDTGELDFEAVTKIVKIIEKWKELKSEKNLKILKIIL
ncbi:beta-N-acetylglucosaminidase domain-containing protein [Mycoplasmopsis cricetuli]|uniref:beta-N-acetylglucosaminidase domain-containing protein n=1 Tax=Mycoplasmopsis cricetuli TaxID=171283 RepID=UPI0004710794|nr:beta-N-acetylglucosaminidase domain-containing protein [Mycoplasmopsis cricetuli]